MTLIPRLIQLLELQKATPEDPFLWFALAKEYEKMGDYSEALQWFEKLVNEAPQEVGTYYHFARLLASTQQYKKAIAVIQLGEKTAIAHGDMKASSELNQLHMEIEEE